MKQGVIFLCSMGMCLGLLLGSSGCGTNRDSQMSGPGSVLGLGPDRSKVVTFEVVGKGLEPENALTKGEAKLMAERAAIADGYRQMVEKLRGVYVDAHMKAGFSKVDQDMLVTQTQSWLRGVEVVQIRTAQYGITEAQMKLRIYFAKKGMVWWPGGLGNEVIPPQDQHRSLTERIMGK